MADPKYEKVALAHHDELGYHGGALPQYYSVSRKAEKRTYRPVILRTASLLALLTFTISLIGLLQYALIRLPNAQGRFGVDTIKDVTDPVGSAFPKRDTIPLSTDLPDYTEAPTMSTARNNFVPTETPLSSAALSDYVGTIQTLELAEPTPAVSSYVQALETPKHTAIRAGYTEAPTMSAAASNYVPIDPATHPPAGIYVPDQETKGAVVFKWTPLQVFLGAYLAVLLAVFYRILISTAQTQLRLIDPFRQLRSSKGALASSAFFASYHSQTVFGPLSALFSGRYCLFAIGIASWISCLLPAFASEAIFVDTNWSCSDPKVGSPNACLPRTTASVLVVRLLQGLLSLMALILVVLVFTLRGEIGLESDPSSIAAVATLMGHPSLEDDLSNLPSGPGINVALMNQEMGQKRYRLDTWTGKSSDLYYGIVPGGGYRSEATSVAHRSTIVDWSSSVAKYQPVDPRSSAYKADMTTHRWRWGDILLLFFVTGAFGVVLAYYLVGGDNGFNRFFNSSTFGPRFILTVSATIIANIWGSVEQNSMVMAPFVRLSNGSSSFDTLSFAPTITPILSTWRAMSRGYLFAGTVTIMTLLAEILSIAISGVPFATGQTWLNFLVVSYISMSILGIMTLVAVTVIIHRRYEPNISVVPDTLGAKMSYLGGSKMLANFYGNTGVSGENRLRSGRYAFRPVIEKDGKRLWKVDQHVRQGEE